MRYRQHSFIVAAAAAHAAWTLFPSAARAQYEAPDPAYAAPANYYSTATSANGAVLKQQLNDIIDGHTLFSYDAARDILPILDRDPDNPNNVLLVYSGDSVQGAWSSGGTIWNREHLWCDSYGIEGAGIDYSDLFNLRPSHPGVNSDRSNEYYDDVDPAFRMVAHPDAPLCYEDSRIADTSQSQMWEPRPVEKGDIARSLFYMDTRYDGADSGTTNLTLIENVAAITTANSYMGRLSTLLRWHYQDGITNEERRRNDLIYENYQGNRNPYVDRPELVWAVFGGGANNAQIHVGPSNPPNGASSTSVNLRVIAGAASWGTADVAIQKLGAHPTTYDVTTAGDATTSAAGAGHTFDYDTQSRTIEVSLNGPTGAVGTVSGTITLDNTDLTTGGFGLGSGDGDDIIHVTGTVLDHAQPSFVAGAAASAQSIDFGYLPAGGFALRQALYAIHNNAAGAGAAFTAGLDVDGVARSGSILLESGITPGDPAVPLAAGASRNYIATLTPGDSEGLATATHTIALSDEDVPGATARPSLVLTTSGRTTAGSFPVSGQLFLYDGETFTTTHFAIGQGATITKQGPGTLNIAGAHTHGDNAHLIAEGGPVNLLADAGASGQSGLKLTVSSAPVTFHSAQHLRALDVQGDASIAPGGAHMLVVGDFTAGAGGRLNLSDNSLIVRSGTAGAAGDSGVYDGIQGEVQRGRNGGTWDGAGGIVTTTADAINGLTSIGVAIAADVLNVDPAGTTVWKGQTISGTDVLAMYTWAGDANLDGLVSGDDYTAIDFAIATPGVAGWINGDFNYDGFLSGDDYTIIDFMIAAQGAPFATAAPQSALAAVPEPSACGIGSLAAATLLARRRRPRRASIRRPI